MTPFRTERPRKSGARVAAFTSLVAATLALAFTASTVPASAALPAAASTCALSAKLVPTCGVLQGAYVEARSGESYAQAYSRFETQIGTHQSILHYYHQGSDLFPTPWEISLANSDGGRRLLINWKPEAGHTWSQVAAGAADAYIDREAAYLRTDYRDPFYLIIHHEPENEVVNTAGSGYTAANYAQMYRHVEDRLKADGVTNAVFVMNYMGTQTYVTRSWFDDLWPGDRYVDWVAYDPYVTSALNGQTGGFDWLMNAHWGDSFPGMYAWLVAKHPGMPIMLAEWGIGEKAGDPNFKANLFGEVAAKLKNYPALKGMSYFDKLYADVAGDVRVDTSAAPLASYRRMAADPAFHSTLTLAAPVVSSAIKFVAADTIDANATTFKIKIPQSVSAGDALILFAAQGVAAPLSGPGSGWTQVGRMVDGTQVTTAWQRVATSTDAGRSVNVGDSVGYSKAALTIAAYRGTSSTDPTLSVAAAPEPGTSASHTTPTVAGGASGAWRLSFWSEKSNATTAWASMPAGDTKRASAVGSGQGRMSSLLTDSGSGVSAAVQGGLTATSNSATKNATSWTILLQPAS